MGIPLCHPTLTRKSIQIAIAFILLTLFLAVAPANAQSDNKLPDVCQGSLLFKSPIAGGYEEVPLKHTDVVLDVRGLVSSATVTQQYSNSSSAPIEAVYVFPLPHDAAVYDMEIRVGNRLIRSTIRERAEAKKIYEAAKAEGKRAALVEQERPNIFTTSVANIMPGDTIDVRLRYVEPLKWENGTMRLDFPIVVGPRYIPGTQAVGHQGEGWAMDSDAVRDASRITPPVRNPDSRPGHDISLAVDIDSGLGSATVNSISHKINIRKLPDGRQRVELASGTTIPNKDFILELHQEPGTSPTTALFLSPTSAGDAEFLLATYPPTSKPSSRVPLEMLYMIDISGSMEGTSIKQAREALLSALDRLTTNDRFAILAFNDKYREFSPEPMPATPQNVEAARQYVRNLNASGGTEMLPALQHLMHKPQPTGYLRHIVLLTDGDLGNEDQIFMALRGDLGNARLYTVAIGSAPNLFLATKMAQYGRGTFTHIADNSETREKVSQLFDKIENPVLTDVNLSFEGVEVTDVYPHRLPDLFLGEPLVIYGRISKGHLGKLHLSARSGNEPFDVTVPFDTSKASFHPGITTIWARQRVEELMDQYRHAEEPNQPEVRSAIVAHAIQYRLVTKFTSLVAVEEVVVNPGGGSNKVAVPTELPEGMQMDSVFGAPATGTADQSLEALGLALLGSGIALLYFTRKQRNGVVA
jgi:Ca-activated chloride channel homolog